MATSGIVSPTTDRSAEALAFERNFSYLVESVDAGTVLAEARSKGLITSRQWSKCSRESDPYEKADEFLGYLYRTINGNWEKFHTFLEILDQNGQEEIAERLRGKQIIIDPQSCITSSNPLTDDLAEVARSQPDEPTEGKKCACYTHNIIIYCAVITEQWNNYNMNVPGVQPELVVPDELVMKLANLRSAYALLLMRFERALQSSSEAQEDFVAFLRHLLQGAVPSDCNVRLAFEILKEEEISLFNIQYLKNVSSILPDDVRWV